MTSNTDQRQKCPNCGMFMEPFPTSIEAERDELRKRAEKAEAELVEATVDHSAALRRLSKANNGVAMLRRLNDRVCTRAEKIRLHAGDDEPAVQELAIVSGWIDGMVAEAEKPAEQKRRTVADAVVGSIHDCRLDIAEADQSRVPRLFIEGCALEWVGETIVVKPKDGALGER